jgi:hypothetical protein
MRLALIAILLAVLTAAPAAAAAGYKGRVTTTITLGSAYFKAADPYGRSGLQPGDFTIPPVTGMLYVAGPTMRLDMNAPSGTVTTLLDERGGYYLNHKLRRAWRFEHEPEIELPLFNLEQLASDWAHLSKYLSTVEGLRIAQLGSKRINGQRCRGLQLSGDVYKLTHADEVQIVPGLPVLSTAKGTWHGSVWVSERLGIPLKITSNYSGIALTWEVAGLESWDVPELMLRVPRGYDIRES